VILEVLPEMVFLGESVLAWKKRNKTSSVGHIKVNTL
jgi:hypothetical protein